MDTFLQVVLVNAVLAGLLALAVGIVARFVKRPEVAYWLWALVLLKLVTPPLFNMPIPLDHGTAAPREVAAQQVLPPLTTVAGGQRRDRAERPRPPAAPGAPVGMTATGGTSLMPEQAAQAEQQSPPPGGQPPAGAGGIPWRWIVLCGWLAGSAAWFSLAGVRLLRFGRLIARSHPAPKHLLIAARQLCERLGVRRCPDLRVSGRGFRRFCGGRAGGR